MQFFSALQTSLGTTGHSFSWAYMTLLYVDVPEVTPLKAQFIAV